MLRIVGLIVAVLVMMLPNGQSVIAENENITIVPDEKIQSFLASIQSRTFTEEDKKMFSELGEKYWKIKLAELERMVDGHHERLVPQLIYYQIHAKDMEGAILSGFVINQLGVSKKSITLGLIPYLDTEDERLKQEAYSWLDGVDYDRATRTRDYSYYQSCIETRKDNPPEGLIRYMYYRSPETALSTLMDIHRLWDKESIIKTEQIIREDIHKRQHARGVLKISPEAMSALIELSQHKQWYIHLYVVEIMRQHPEFRRPDIIKRLEKDKHPIIQNALKELKDK